MNQFNQNPNMVYMSPPNSNNFIPPIANQSMPQMNNPQNSIGMAIEHFNNFTNINCNEFVEYILESITKDCTQANIQVNIIGIM